jgi:hypothetical protein
MIADLLSQLKPLATLEINLTGRSDVGLSVLMMIQVDATS